MRISDWSSDVCSSDLNGFMAASSNTLHAPRERLSRETIDFHHALVSLMEELEAVDWYRQRADDCDDTQLKEILLPNMREEMEHAAMVLEWIRRTNGDFDKELHAYTTGRAPRRESM